MITHLRRRVRELERETRVLRLALEMVISGEYDDEPPLRHLAAVPDLGDAS